MALEIISRSEAQAKHLRHYFTGKPCKRGHIDIRYVTSRACVVCSLENARRRYEDDPEIKNKAKIRVKKPMLPIHKNIELK